MNLLSKLLLIIVRGLYELFDYSVNKWDFFRINKGMVFFVKRLYMVYMMVWK